MRDVLERHLAAGRPPILFDGWTAGYQAIDDWPDFFFLTLTG